MAEIQVSIKKTEIKRIEYNNDFAGIPGKQLKLEIKTQAKVHLNMATPLSAVVDVVFLAEDPESKIKLEIQTYTPITASSFIDNLDKVIQERYLSSVMLAVNEKIRMITTTVGINLRVPNMVFQYQ